MTCLMRLRSSVIRRNSSGEETSRKPLLSAQIAVNRFNVSGSGTGIDVTPPVVSCQMYWLPLCFWASIGHAVVLCLTSMQLSGLGPAGLFPFVTYSIFPSLLTLTSLGCQAVGMSPTSVGTGDKLTTPTALMPPSVT